MNALVGTAEENNTVAKVGEYMRAGDDDPDIRVIAFLPNQLSDAIEVAIIRQFGRYPPSAVDDQAIRLRATHQLVEGARIEKDETRWTAFGDRPKLPRLDDRLRHRTRHRDCIA
jgi:hypothetical protein